MLYQLKNITKLYGEGDNSVRALNGLSLGIQEGQFAVILGSSGSGKSTLLNILGAIDKCTSGEMRFGGENISNLNNRQATAFRKKNIGFVFQRYNLLNRLTAFENVRFSCEISGVATRFAEQALERVGLAGRAKHYPAELSGGEQQRISIARAIAKKPPVLLCDEPTGALDAKAGADVIATLREINLDYKTAVIVATHNRDIAQMANVVITMRDGQALSITENG